MYIKLATCFLSAPDSMAAFEAAIGGSTIGDILKGMSPEVKNLRKINHQRSAQEWVDQINQKASEEVGDNLFARLELVENELWYKGHGATAVSLELHPYRGCNQKFEGYRKVTFWVDLRYLAGGGSMMSTSSNGNTVDPWWRLETATKVLGGRKPTWHLSAEALASLLVGAWDGAVLPGEDPEKGVTVYGPSFSGDQVTLTVT